MSANPCPLHHHLYYGEDGDKCHMDVSVQDGDKCHLDVLVQDGDKCYISKWHILPSCTGTSKWNLSMSCTGTAICTTTCINLYPVVWLYGYIMGIRGPYCTCAYIYTCWRKRRTSAILPAFKTHSVMHVSTGCTSLNMYLYI